MQKTLIGLVVAFGLSIFAPPTFAEAVPATSTQVTTNGSAKPAKKMRHAKKVNVKKSATAGKNSAPKGRRHHRRHAARAGAAPTLVK